MSKAPTTVWVSGNLFFLVSKNDFITANNNLVATGNILGSLTSMRQGPIYGLSGILLSAQEYALLRIAIRGIDHIKATAKDVASIFCEKCKIAEAAAAHRATHDPYDFRAAANSSGYEDSTAIMTPKTVD